VLDDPFVSPSPQGTRGAARTSQEPWAHSLRLKFQFDENSCPKRGQQLLKFEVIEAEPGGCDRFDSILITGSYDDIGKEHSSFSVGPNKSTLKKQGLKIRDHKHATELLFAWIEHNGGHDNPTQVLSDLGAIGWRIVHGGDQFDGPGELTGEVIGRIEALEDLAPMHNKSALEVIRVAPERVKDRMPMIGVFDTAFHRTIPERARLYGLPLELAQKHKIRRYGFHGISHRYMILRYAALTHKPATQLKLITLHLEGGSSVAGIQRGQSVDTSMGFTPLEGLMMGTRSGDLDPAVNLALDIFCYRVRKYVGAYLAVLGGADAIVTGGISENTPFVRERIFEHFDWCGATLDGERNNNTVDCEGPITTPESRLPIWVVPTQEGLMIAKEVADYLGENHRSS
jgi:acetate kinase